MPTVLEYADCVVCLIATSTGHTRDIIIAKG